MNGGRKVNKKLFRGFSLLLLTVLIFSLVGCDTSSNTNDEERNSVEKNTTETNGETTVPEDEDITIAVVPKLLGNPVYLDSELAAKEAGQELGVKIEWVASAKADAAEQIQVIEGLISKKVDGLLIAANDPNALNDVIKKATDAGIKVATFDSDAADSSRIFYTGTDNYLAGKKSGELMVEKVKDSEEIKCAILTGNLGAFNLEERIRGFKDAIEGSNITVTSIQSCEDDINKAVQVIEQYTKANADLNAWFFAGGWPLFAPPANLEILGEFAKNCGVTVAVDSFYPMLQYVKNGYVDNLVGQRFDSMGDIGVKMLYKAIKGEEVEDFYDTGLDLIDKDNIEEALKTRKEWK